MLPIHPRRARPSVRADRTWCRLSLESLETRSLLSASPLLDLSTLQTDINEFAASRILVKVRPGDTDGPGSLPFGTSGWSSVQAIGSGLWQVDLPTGVEVDKALAAYGGLGDVAYAQPDYLVHATVVPNDPRFSALYGLHNTGQTGGVADADIDATEAWDLHRGSGNTIVGVIDTGVDYSHPDLAANMWTNAGEIADNGVDDEGNGYIDDLHGYDFVNNDGNPMDDNGHGTHVAGTIGAVGDNGLGVVGVNWSVKIMALKFLSASGSGSTSSAVRALQYAVRMGAHLTNNSWGGGGYNQSLYDAIAQARQAGQVFVAAAGNEGSNNDAIASYPANYTLDNVVSVGATDSKNLAASFSNYGATTVDLFAPGVAILSTTPNNTYSSFSGTSMATPHVTGALALLRDMNPSLTYDQLIARLKSTVDVLPALQGKAATGGRLNLARLLNGEAPGDGAGARITGAVFSGTNSTSFNTVRLTFNEAIEAATLTAADLRLTTPGGTLIAASGIRASSNSEFEVTFPTQSSGGTYRLEVGPDVRDPANNAMNQDGDATNGEDPADRFTATHSISTTYTVSNNTRLTIPDLGVATSSITVSTALALTDVNVRLGLSHTYDSDLIITLKGPDGTQVNLVNRRGGSADNFTGTTLDDEASTSISAGRAPFSGTFRPEQPLSAFDGRSSRGAWKLEIRDAASRDVGKLTSWSLVFQGTATTASVRGTADSPANGSFGDGRFLGAVWEAPRNLFAAGRDETPRVLARQEDAQSLTPASVEPRRVVVDQLFAGARRPGAERDVEEWFSLDVQ